MKNETIWKRCDYWCAEQYRSRILTGSIGLEGPWSKWQNGKPTKMAMNRQYEYRRKKQIKKVFLDLGHHYGQGMKEFIGKLGIDHTWEVHAWEPNPYTRARWPNWDDLKREMKFPCPACAPVVDYNDCWWGSMPPEPIRCQMHDEAIWVHGDGIEMHFESNNGANDGWGSTIVEESSHKNLAVHERVPTVDFYEWLLQNTTDDDEVYIKMDIEGAEFEVLRYMIARHKADIMAGGIPGVIVCPVRVKPSPFPQIKKMWIEPHERYVPGETLKTRNELFDQLRQLTDVELHW